MKKAIAIAMLGAGALLLNGCADQTPRTTNSLMHEIEVQAGTNVIVRSASAMPPGIYPGRQYDVKAYERQRYETYTQVAQPWIVRLVQRQGAMARGEIKRGCIGEDVLTCMATLAQTLAVTTPLSSLSIDPLRGTISMVPDDPLLQQVKTAVDGKLIFSRTLKFTAYIPGQDEGILPAGIAISVDLDSNRRINRMSAVLPHDPIAAHTEQEYDKTGIFQLLTAAGVQTCKLNRMDLYRTFEAQLKPGLRSSHDIDVDMSSASETYGKQGKLTVCGRSVWFFSFGGVSTDLIGPGNWSGNFGGGSLDIE